MHPERDQLLRDLICRAARYGSVPGDLSVIDAGWEFQRLLARIAAESSEADWSPEVAEMIGRARVELASQARTSTPWAAHPWGVSNHRVRKALLARLDDESSGWIAERLAASLVQFATSAEDKQQTRDALLTRLSRQTRGEVATQLVSAIAHLDPTPEDKRHARGALLALLTRTAIGEGRRSPTQRPRSDDRGTRLSSVFLASLAERLPRAWRKECSGLTPRPRTNTGSATRFSRPLRARPEELSRGTGG